MVFFWAVQRLANFIIHFTLRLKKVPLRFQVKNLFAFSYIIGYQAYPSAIMGLIFFTIPLLIIHAFAIPLLTWEKIIHATIFFLGELISSEEMV